MCTPGMRGTNAVAWFSMVLLLLSPGGVCAALMQAAVTPKPAAPPAAPKTAAPQTAAPQTAAPIMPAPDLGWPRRYLAPNGAQIVVHEPQVATWENQKLLTLYVAVSHTAKGSNQEHIGTVMAEADTRVSVSERLVDFSSFRILRSNFPSVPKEQVGNIAADLTAAMPLGERVIALDRVLAAVDASAIRPKNVDGLKADPPAIFFSTKPAVVVNIDGDPIWSPIMNNDLTFAVNTNWDLFEHAPSKTFYLRHESQWLKAASVSGPWTATGELPASFAKLPAEEGWKDVHAALPRGAAKASTAPTVFVSTVPAELILLRGEAQYEPVAGTKLVWVRNTDSDVFRLGQTGAVYYLVAGRWFTAANFTGPWTFATLTLPADFAKIPLEHERSRVLASVPGTAQAAEAVLLAQVPQTARVSKKEVRPPDVTYQGAPEFQPIPQTTVARATNTDKDIIKVGDVYYMCFQGVWFMSKSASGPWEVTGSVPQQIYEIPVSSPAHNVTYVTVEDDDDDWVVFASAAAYTGVMIGWGCAVWGSGYYYPPYVGYGGFYPAYFPYYPTYGYSASYNPWTGTYGRGAAVYGPYGGAGVGARYNPRSGTYARGAAAYGPYGARGYAEAYNPRTGAVGATRQGAGVYGSWGSTGVQRGDQWATTRRVTNNVTDTTTRVTRTDQGSAVTRRGDNGGVAATSGGNVFAGHDGNVYRKQGDSWQKYDNGSWGGGDTATPRAQDRSTPARTEPSTINQLDRDSAARSDGARRTQDASSVRSSGSSNTRSSGSYRPSGGMRGGGGRRR